MQNLSPTQLVPGTKNIADHSSQETPSSDVYVIPIQATAGTTSIGVCPLTATVWLNWGFPGGCVSKESTCNAGDVGRCKFDPQVRKIPLEEGMATHSSMVAWWVPRTERLQSTGSQRVGHEWSVWPRPHPRRTELQGWWWVSVVTHQLTSAAAGITLGKNQSNTEYLLFSILKLLIDLTPSRLSRKSRDLYFCQ